MFISIFFYHKIEFCKNGRFLLSMSHLVLVYVIHFLIIFQLCMYYTLGTSPQIYRKLSVRKHHVTVRAECPDDQSSRKDQKFDFNIDN